MYACITWRTPHTVADTVIMMDCYMPENVTEKAKAIAAGAGASAGAGVCQVFGNVAQRVPLAEGFRVDGKRMPRTVGTLLYTAGG